MTERSRWRRPGRIVAFVAVAVVVLAAVALLVVNAIAADPGPTAVAAMESDESTTVIRESGAYLLLPAAAPPSCVGLVFYPGGLVEGEAYAAHLRPLAEAGHPVSVIDPPLNLAVLDADGATDAIARLPEVDHWVVGGHSLGGAMAGRFAAGSQVAGLLMWAAFPPGDDDLSDKDLAVTSIYGTEDGLASADEVTGAADRLPPDAEFVAVDGGNHAQFGDYGTQRGDRPAGISAEEQRSIVVDASLDLIDRLDGELCR